MPGEAIVLGEEKRKGRREGRGVWFCESQSTRSCTGFVGGMRWVEGMKRFNAT